MPTATHPLQVRQWGGTSANVMGNSVGADAGVDFNKAEGELRRLDGGTAPARAATILTGLPQAARGDRQRAYEAVTQHLNLAKIKRARVVESAPAAQAGGGVFRRQAGQNARPLAIHTTVASLTSATGHAATLAYQAAQRDADARAHHPSYFVEVRTMALHPEANRERMAALAAAAVDEFEFIHAHGLPAAVPDAAAQDHLGVLVLLF